MQQPTGIVDIEFTLALNNRTGKYFFCQDLINAAPDEIESILYWRLALKRMPTGPLARILGRLAADEIKLRAAFPLLNHWLPLLRRRRPVVFMDPREVILHALKAADYVVCHDVGPITHPELYQPHVKATYSMAFAKICAAKPAMIFVSSSSMTEFIALYGNDFRAMTVISPPLRTGITNGTDEALPGVQPPYFLTVGSIGTRKNQIRVIEAFALSGLSGRGYSYVVCGGPEPGSEAVARLAGKTLGVVQLGYVSDPQLRWLYRNAIGFVLPSLLEGFGLPAAEAITYGLVPLVGRGGALHEVTGDSAILVNPMNIEEIADGLESLVALTPVDRQKKLRALKRSIDRFGREEAIAEWKRFVLDVNS